MVFVLPHDHADEIAAIANALYVSSPELLEVLQETRPYLFREELNNKFIIIKEWAVTEHIGWFSRPDGVWQQQRAKSYCYKFVPEWLEKHLSFRALHPYTYIDESFEARVLLEKARAEGSTPLCHWQSRRHVNLDMAITAHDLPDGYLIDNRKKPFRGLNVVTKRFPSLLDVSENPRRYKGNPVADLVLMGKISLRRLKRNTEFI
ncbi:MAG TPA: hypothetical protein EYP19_03065 [Desulfobacterales bacterium]|nr:hypothetical protein [Desulfobacterales bacterium]